MDHGGRVGVFVCVSDGCVGVFVLANVFGRRALMAESPPNRFGRRALARWRAARPQTCVVGERWCGGGRKGSALSESV